MQRPRSRGADRANDDERRDGGEQDEARTRSLRVRITRKERWSGIGCAGTIARPWSRLEAVRKGIVQLVAIGS